MVTPSWESFQKPSEPEKEEDQVASFIEQEHAKELPGEIEEEIEPEADKPQWGSFDSPLTYQGEPDPTAEESEFGYTIRNAVTNSSRVGEQVAGRYGNIEEFGKELLVNFPKTGGVFGWALSELMGKDRWKQLVKGRQGQEQKFFPASEDLKGISQGITGGYTTPKTSGEEHFQNYIENISAAQRGGPVPGRNPFSTQLINKIGIPITSEAVKDATQWLGFGDEKANIAKGAVWMTAALMNNVNASGYASQRMNEGRRGFPATLRADVVRLQGRINNLRNDPTMLTSDPRSREALAALDALERDIASGQVSQQSLMTGFDGVSARQRSAAMFELGRDDRNFARAQMNKVKNVYRDEIQVVGAGHPEALAAWQDGVCAWAIIHRSQAVTNYVQDVIKGPYGKVVTGSGLGLFGVGETASLVAAPKITGMVTATGTTGGLAAYKTGQVLYRMWNNDTLRNYYFQAINAAAMQNASAFASNYAKLQAGLDAEEKKEQAEVKKYKEAKKDKRKVI